MLIDFLGVFNLNQPVWSRDFESSASYRFLRSERTFCQYVTAFIWNSMSVDKMVLNLGHERIGSQSCWQLECWGDRRPNM